LFVVYAKDKADKLAKEETIEVPPNQFIGICFSVGKKQDAIGTESSRLVHYLYWLPTIRSADEIPSA
jgi:hypothetical protein